MTSSGPGGKASTEPLCTGIFLETPAGLQQRETEANHTDRAGCDIPTGLKRQNPESRASSRVGWRRKWQPTSIFLPGRSHRQIDEPGGLHSIVSQKSETQLSN